MTDFNLVTVRIKVTQDHIDGGCPENGCLCPIALAVQEKLNLDARGWSVSSYAFWVELNKQEISVVVAGRRHNSQPADNVLLQWRSDHATWNCLNSGYNIQFIRRFDRKLTVEPFEFDITVPDFLLKTQETPQCGKILSTRL